MEKVLEKICVFCGVAFGKPYAAKGAYFYISVFFEISRFFAYPVRISASAPSQVMLQAAANPSWMANTANISATPESPNFRIPVRVPSDTITVPQGSPGVPMEQVARSTEKITMVPGAGTEP